MHLASPVGLSVRAQGQRAKGTSKVRTQRLGFQTLKGPERNPTMIMTYQYSSNDSKDDDNDNDNSKMFVKRE